MYMANVFRNIMKNIFLVYPEMRVASCIATECFGYMRIYMPVEILLVKLCQSFFFPLTPSLKKNKSSLNNLITLNIIMDLVN